MRKERRPYLHFENLIEEPSILVYDSKPLLESFKPASENFNMFMIN